MKSKSALYPGLSLFLCFCLLTGTGLLAARFNSPGLIAAGEAVSFLLPVLLLTGTQEDLRKTLHRQFQVRRLPKGAWSLSCLLGITAAVLSLFLNLGIYQLAGLTGLELTATALNAQPSSLHFLWRVLIIVVLSAVAEEAYLRGALLSVHERTAGTGVCIAMSGVFFALLHGDLLNFAGPLVAGIAYAYLTYAFGSIWPAVAAHMVNNVYYLFVSWLTETYAAFGIWKYFAAVNGLMLLLFLYLSLRAAERLLAKDRIPHFEKSAGWYDVMLLVRNPGMLAFLLAFIVKAVLHWI